MKKRNGYAAYGYELSNCSPLKKCEKISLFHQAVRRISQAYTSDKSTLPT